VVRAQSREQLEQKMAVLRGARVLLVEDNLFNQQVMREMLTEVGLLVDLAENGQLALDQLARSSYEIVLMDLQMPVMDGLTASELLRGNPANKALPVIALTANVDQSDKDRCRQAGMNDHLSKPVVPEQLYETLLRWVAPVSSVLDAVPLPVVAEVSELPVLPGINALPVIKRMRGNVTAYRRLHGLFCQQAAGVPRALRDALAAEDFDAARRLAHTIKGSAGTIGADELSAAADVLEQAYKKLTPAAEAHIAEFETALAVVLAGQLN
jgi:CheY-like chemotaxis protein